MKKESVLKQIEKKTAGEDSISSDLLCGVLALAVSAIYFDDSSDFQSVLWSIVGLIDPKAAKLLKRDECEAYKRYVESTGWHTDDMIDN